MYSPCRSPERLNSPDLRDHVLSGLSAATGLLVVDAATGTGWTLAVAARMLRRSGAEGVFPLVLAVQG
ncbi:MULTISPECIES: hypothetical protein [Streptomyces]|uniref:Uncharacterized protein n=1 Tax=Streptomyces cremeus TaxID=66881 RepID=A0ABV5P8B0_STRCM